MGGRVQPEASRRVQGRERESSKLDMTSRLDQAMRGKRAGDERRPRKGDKREEEKRSKSLRRNDRVIVSWERGREAHELEIKV